MVSRLTNTLGGKLKDQSMSKAKTDSGFSDDERCEIAFNSCIQDKL
jgi:hypothetical protein